MPCLGSCLLTSLPSVHLISVLASLPATEVRPIASPTDSRHYAQHTYNFIDVPLVYIQILRVAKEKDFLSYLF